MTSKDEIDNAKLKLVEKEIYVVDKERILERFQEKGLDVSIEPEGKTTVLWKYRGR